MTDQTYQPPAAPKRWRYSSHALTEMTRRGIAQHWVEQVLASPQQVLAERDGIVALQSRIAMEPGQEWLLRVLVNPEDPAVVVTVYRTSKIAKYWRNA